MPPNPLNGEFFNIIIVKLLINPPVLIVPLAGGKKKGCQTGNPFEYLKKQKWNCLTITR